MYYLSNICTHCNFPEKFQLFVMFLLFKVSKYHVVRPSGHDCRQKNFFEITLNLFKFIFCPIWHDFQSVLQSCTKLHSICINISIIVHKQTFSDDVHLMKYHVVRPSRNNQFGTFVLKSIQRQEVASYTILPRTHGRKNRFVTLFQIWKNITFLRAGMQLPHLDIMWCDPKKTMNFKLFPKIYIFIINFIVTFCANLACFLQESNSVPVNLD